MVLPVSAYLTNKTSLYRDQHQSNQEMLSQFHVSKDMLCFHLGDKRVGTFPFSHNGTLKARERERERETEKNNNCTTKAIHHGSAVVKCSD